MENFLQSLLKEQQETSSAIEKQTKLLSQIYDIEKERARFEARGRNEDKKEKKEAKKKASDTDKMLAALLAGQKKGNKADAQKKPGENGGLGDIVDDLGGVLSGVLGTIVIDRIAKIVNEFRSNLTGKQTPNNPPKNGGSPNKGGGNTNKGGGNTNRGGGNRGGGNRGGGSRGGGSRGGGSRGGTNVTRGRSGSGAGRGTAPRGNTPGRAPNIPKTKPGVQAPRSGFKITPGGLAKGAAGVGITIGAEYLIAQLGNTIEAGIQQRKLEEFMNLSPQEQEKALARLKEKRLKEEKYIEGGGALFWTDKITQLGGDTQAEQKYRHLDTLINAIEMSRGDQSNNSNGNTSVTIDIGGQRVFDSNAQRKQSGGPINVPGTGSGDKVPMMLPSGSFVMNRNAVGMFQSGGMVPTLLEPGEQVYGPGSWDAGHMMMNSLFSRFQTGGEVSADQIQDGANESQAPKGTKMLNVPYYNQRSNKVDGTGRGGDSQCFSTAAAMVVSAVLGKAIVPDVYNKTRSQFGDSTQWPPNQSAMGEFGVPASGGDNGSYASYKAAIDSGKPVILGLQHNAGSGHMVTGIGYTKDGLVVNDPYGRLNETPKGGWAAANLSGEKDNKGAAVTYPKSLMDAIWLDRGPTTGRMYVPGTGGVQDGDPSSIRASTGGSAADGTGTSQDDGGAGALDSILGGLSGPAKTLATGFLTAIGATQDTEQGRAIAAVIAGHSGKGNKTASPSTSSTTGGPDSGPSSVSVTGDFDKKMAAVLGSYEGLRTEAYPDAAHGWSVPTIGIGATYYPSGFRLSGKVKQGDTITEDEAYEIKAAHIKEHRQRLVSEVGAGTYEKIPNNVKFALESKVFNYGSLGNTLTGLVKEAADTGNYSNVSAYYRNTLAHHNGGINDWRRNDEADIIDKGSGSRVPGVQFKTKLQQGGIANTAGQKAPRNAHMVEKSQEQFAQKIAQSMQPIVIPVPTGGGGGPTYMRQGGGMETAVPSLSSADQSIVAMEYKYRITMGASV